MSSLSVHEQEQYHEIITTWVRTHPGQDFYDFAPTMMRIFRAEGLPGGSYTSVLNSLRSLCEQGVLVQVTARNHAGDIMRRAFYPNTMTIEMSTIGERHMFHAEPAESRVTQF